MSGGARPQRWLAAVRVPATSANLGPGFDALGVALSLHLEVAAVPPGPTRVSTRGEGADEVPDDDANLVWSSLVEFCTARDIEAPDVALRVCNEIPLERGLGSSSAAIVAGLALGRALTGSVIGDRELVRLADRIEGHPDNVAPAILGGFVSSTTAADGRLVVRRAQPAAATTAVVAVPGARQNTKQAREALPEGLSRRDVVTQASRAAHVTGALAGAWPIEPDAAGDVLHEPGRLDVLGGTRRVLEAWRAAGAHAWLSGAGPTVTAAVPRLDAGRHDRLASLAADEGFTVRVLDWDLAGVLVCRPGSCAVSGLPGCATCPSSGLC